MSPRISFKFHDQDLLFLGNHNTPLVLDAAVGNVAQPSLDLGSDLTGGSLGAHGDVDVPATVVDLRDGADKVLDLLA